VWPRSTRHLAVAQRPARTGRWRCWPSGRRDGRADRRRQTGASATAVIKIAISGKGGVGKTTVAALLSLEFARRGVGVIAIDADPNPSLGQALGFPSGPLPPLLEMSDEIEERIGTPGGFIRMNPRVDDLVSRVGRTHAGVHLIVAGGVTHGGAGCACPQGVLLRRLLDHVVLESGEAVIVDFEAGLEHLGRRTAEAVDRMLVVADPSRASVETAGRIRRLAAEIGVARVHVVGNRIRVPDDEAWLADHLDGLELIGSVPWDDDVLSAERSGRPITELRGAVPAAIANLADVLESMAHLEAVS
jgi:CO dehydrogenase maturation factor